MQLRRRRGRARAVLTDVQGLIVGRLLPSAVSTWSALPTSGRPLEGRKMPRRLNSGGPVRRHIRHVGSKEVFLAEFCCRMELAKVCFVFLFGRSRISAA